MIGEVRLHARRSPVWRSSAVELYCVHHNQKGVAAFAQPLMFQTVPEGSDWTAPIVQLDTTAAQALMDDLWECGVRPSEGSGSAGSLAATQQHLEDMRSLVFKTPPKRSCSHVGHNPYNCPNL